MTQQAVIDFLSDPASHDGTAPRRIETHGAIVFLLPDRVYKLKRAVSYSFMDFSTAEKRRAACQSEVTLNRRTAPDLYRGTIPILESGNGTLTFGGLDSDPPNAIETLVLMRRFDGTLADRLPTDAELSDLAETVADFHDAQSPLADFGGARAMTAVQAGNLDFLDHSDAVDDTLATNLRSAATATIERLAALLDRRAAAGFVRHCHGDLHLANVCRWQGRPTLFDCIEFNPDFARIDTLYDLAFLLMDLDGHGRRAGGCLVLNRYLERRPGEVGGLELLPLFLSMRAQVRAKVGFAAADLEDGESADAARDDATVFLERALGYLTSPDPVLIAVGGPSGSGKSTLAKGLAPSVGASPGAVIARSDAIRKRLFGAKTLTDRLSSDAYSTSASVATYAEMERVCRATASGGHAAIADATFTHPDSRRRIRALAADTQCRFVGFWLDLDRETAQERVSARRGDASDATETVVSAQYDSDWGHIDWHRIDARLSLDEQTDRCRAVLNRATSEIDRP